MVYEFDFSVVDALRGISEVCFLLSEYRSRILTYKYANYDEQDMLRKIARLKQKKKEEGDTAFDDLDDGLLVKQLVSQQDKWEE